MAHGFHNLLNIVWKNVHIWNFICLYFQPKTEECSEKVEQLAQKYATQLNTHVNDVLERLQDLLNNTDAILSVSTGFIIYT